MDVSTKHAINLVSTPIVDFSLPALNPEMVLGQIVRFLLSLNLWIDQWTGSASELLQAIVRC
jgi:hypothetical protein